MREVEPCLYKATWLLPGGIELDCVRIEVSITDEFGNTVIREASGKLQITSNSINRLSGELRYDTAIEISNEEMNDVGHHYPCTWNGVCRCTCRCPNSPYKLNASILLTPSDELWDATMDEIERLGASEVDILGGPNAISNEVSADVEKRGLDVNRIAGIRPLKRLH